jgi:hypothetical protein
VTKASSWSTPLHRAGSRILLQVTCKPHGTWRPNPWAHQALMDPNSATFKVGTDSSWNPSPRTPKQNSKEAPSKAFGVQHHGRVGWASRPLSLAGAAGPAHNGEGGPWTHFSPSSGIPRLSGQEIPLPEHGSVPIPTDALLGALALASREERTLLLGWGGCWHRRPGHRLQCLAPGAFRHPGPGSSASCPEKGVLSCPSGTNGSWGAWLTPCFQGGLGLTARHQDPIVWEERRCGLTSCSRKGFGESGGEERPGFRVMCELQESPAWAACVCAHAMHLCTRKQGHRVSLTLWGSQLPSVWSRRTPS